MTCHVSLVNITTNDHLYSHTVGNMWEVWYISAFTYAQTQYINISSSFLCAMHHSL